MPYRKTPLINDHFYHILNRGVAYQPTFSIPKDYNRFHLFLSYYRHQHPPVRLSRLLQIPKDDRLKIIQGLENANNLIVDIVAFCFMPNHFHLLLKQVAEGGISQFMRKVADGYTRYFNTKHRRIGPIFQGAFKAVHVSSDEQLLHLSRYIHLNPLVSAVVTENSFLNYPWSSLTNYIDTSSSSFINSESILQSFKSPQKYLEFVMDQAEYGKRLEEIKHLILE